MDHRHLGVHARNYIFRDIITREVERRQAGWMSYSTTLIISLHLIATIVSAQCQLLPPTPAPSVSETPTTLAPTSLPSSTTLPPKPTDFQPLPSLTVPPQTEVTSTTSAPLSSIPTTTDAPSVNQTTNSTTDYPDDFGYHPFPTPVSSHGNDSTTSPPSTDGNDTLATPTPSPANTTTVTSKACDHFPDLSASLSAILPLILFMHSTTFGRLI